MPKRENISYLIPRDPSVRSWSDRYKNTVICPKNLFGMNEEDEEVGINNIKVFLRLKPTPFADSPYKVLNSTTLQSEAPKESVTFKNVSNNVGKLVNKFTFTSILDQNSSQAELFKKCVMRSFQKFFKNGENYVLMAYGTTSAGKTFTMQGDVERPGVIPRALDSLFNSLKDSIVPVCAYQPFQCSDLLTLSDENLRKNLSHKNFILSLDLTKLQKYPDASQISSQTSSSGFSDMYENVTFKEMQTNLIDTESFDLLSDSEKFSVWISMIEIYNEQVYDLLELPSDKNTLPKLALKSDEYGNMFVKGLRYVNVVNGHEAFQLFQFGRRNLHIAPTALNERSSRSHCIFTITLARFLNYGISSEAVVSRFSFCDLAGMERAKKTLNARERLVESKSINTSLSIFVKCLMTIKKNQNSKEKQIIPYRESKLTKLFRDAMIGKEHFSLIVNVTSDPNMFDETVNVLKFSSVAQEIVPQNVFIKSKVTKIKSRFSKIVVDAPYVSAAIDWHVSEAVKNNKTEQDGETIMELRDLVKSLTEEVARERKLREEIEEKIREELTTQFSETMKRQYELHKERLQNETESIQEMYERRQKRIINYYETFYKSKRKKYDTDDLSSDDCDEEEMEKLRNLEIKVNSLTSENESLKEKVEELEEENQKFRSECVALKFKLVEKGKVLDKMRMTNEANDAGGNALVTELKKQLEEDNAKISDLKSLLEEAAVDHKNLEENNKYLYKAIETTQDQLHQNSEVMERLREENHNLEERCNDLESEVKVLRKELKDMILTAKQEKEKIIEEEKLKREKEIIRHDEEVSKLNEKIESLQRELNVKETQVNTEEICKLNEKIGLLQNVVKTMEWEKNEEAVRHVKEVSELREEIVSLQKNIEEKVTSTTEVHAEEIFKLNEQITLLQSTIDNMEKDMKEESQKHAEEISKLNEKIKMLEIEIEKKKIEHKAFNEIQNNHNLQVDYTPERLSKQIEALSIHRWEEKSTKKKVDLLEDIIHPSTAKNAVKTRTRKAKKEKEVKASEGEKENIELKKNKCHKQLFTENDFDGLTSLNASPLEEHVPRLRPRK